MDTESIVRRIIDLKKVSVQLKQSTQNPTIASNQLIQSILQIGKSIASSPNSVKNEKQNNTSLSANNQQPHQPSPKNQPTPTNLLLKLLQNPPKPQPHNPAYNQSQLEHSASGFESSTGTATKAYHESIAMMTPAQQITELRQYNGDLEEEIRSLKEKLRRLEEIERQEREEEWKDGLPYFVINIPRLRIFYTKLTIAQKDYDKIDFCLYSVSLTLQKITLTQLPQTPIASRPPKSISLALLDLKQASYITKKATTSSANKNGTFSITLSPPRAREQQEEFMIVYYFKGQKTGNSGSNGKVRSKSGKKSAFSRMKVDDKIKQDDEQIIETLFLKFQNSQQLKQWDLGVYINYKIMQDINKGQFKIDSYNSMNSSTLVIEEVGKKENEKNGNGNGNGKNGVKFGELLERMVQNKGNIVGGGNQEDSQEQEGGEDKKNNQQINVKKPPSLQKLNSNIENPPDSPTPKKANNNIKIIDQIQSPSQQSPKNDSLEQEIINKERSNTSHFGGQIPMMILEDKVKQAEQERVQAEEAKRQKMIEMEEIKRKEAERMQAMKRTQYELSIKRAKESLRRGYILTKYAKSALHPYQKKVFLSDDGKRLCWQDSKSPGGQPKWILINEIVNVSQGTLGKGIESHMNVKKINRKGCFALIYLDSKDRKTLEFGCKDEATMDQFCKDLELFRKNGKAIM